MDSSVIDGSRHCVRVLDGVEYVVLQAESQTSQMEWSIAIAHSISVENGGGVLLDKAKMGVTGYGGAGLDSAGFPSIYGCVDPPSSDFHATNPEDLATSIVFAKPCKLNPISEISQSHSRKLNTSHVTEATRGVSSGNITCLTNNVELSPPLEHFASNVFDAHKNAHSSKKSFPMQALSSEHPWYMIDRASSESSASEIFDKVSNFDENTQLNACDYSKLVQLTEAAGVSK